MSQLFSLKQLDSKHSKCKTGDSIYPLPIGGLTRQDIREQIDI